MPTPPTFTFDIHTMTDLCHNALVAEINDVSRLPVTERLELARRRRLTQLERYAVYERQVDGSTRTKDLSKNRSPVTPGKKNESDRPRSTLNTIRDSSSRRRRQRPDSISFTGSTTLLEAVTRKDLDEVRSLLLSGHCDVNSSVVNGLTALHQACIDGHLPLVKILVAQPNIDVNVRDADQWTPLHTAALCGQAAIATILTDHDADLLALNCDGFMPYDLCEDEPTLDIIESAMARQAITQEMINNVRSAPEKAMLHDLHRLSRDHIGLDFKGENGETPLHVAAVNGYVEVAEYLLDKAASINAVDNDSWQPIHCAAYWRQVPMLELLIKHGADLDAVTDDNKKPMDLCPDETVCKWMEELKESIRAAKSNSVPAFDADGNSTFGDNITDILTSSTAVLLRSNPVDGSHTSLYTSNLTLADKSIMSSSLRKLTAAASHDKESEMMRRDARNEAEIWTSMQSIHEDDNDDETMRQQIDGFIIEPPKEFQSRPSSANAVNNCDNDDVIIAARRSKDVAQQRSVTSNDRKARNDLDLVNIELQRNGHRSSKNVGDRSQSSSGYVIVDQPPTSGVSDGKTSSSNNATTTLATVRLQELTPGNGNGTNDGFGAAQSFGMTSYGLKKQRSERRQRNRESGSEEINSTSFSNDLTASTSTYNEEMYRNITKEKQRRCCVICAVL